MYTRFLHIFLFLSVAFAMGGQEYQKKNFKVYLTKDGLSYNKINTIIQDAYGYIWIGTEKGLNRFDGSTFQQFYSDSVPESLPEDRVFNFRWIDNENLGTLTASGLNIINTKTLKMRNLMVPEDSSRHIANLNRVYDVLADKNRNIFISTSSGFYHFHQDQLVFRYDHAPGKNGVPGFGWDLAAYRDGTILLSTTLGLYIYNINKKDLHQLNDKDDPFLHLFITPGKTFRFTHTNEKHFSISKRGQREIALFDIQNKIKLTIQGPDSFGEKWEHLGQLFRLNDTLIAAMSTASGFFLVRHHKETNSWILDTTHYFENDYCTNLLLDKNNRLWVATTDGLYKQDKPGRSIQHIRLPSDGPSYSKTITGLAVANNKLFVATAAQGIYVFDRDSLGLSHHMLDKVRPSFITTLLKINEDSLLATNSSNIIDTRKLAFTKLLQEKDGSKPTRIQTVLNDSRDRIYFTKNMVDTLYFKDPWEKSFSSVRIPALKKIRSAIQIAEDIEGNLWLGGQGLVRLNKTTKELDLFLDSFPAIKAQRKDLSSNLVFDRNGKIYFGVENDGLIIYDVKQKKISQVTRQNGLPDNTIEALYLHENKTLWIATENGLASYELTNGLISAFGASDGMPTDATRCNALYYDSVDRQLYAAFTPNIIRFDPLKLEKNKTPPHFFIERIDISGKDAVYHPAGTVTVPYKNNSVIVNLTAINYEDASQQQFAYRILKDGNENWQELGSQNKIFFNNLAVGKNKLQIKVYIRNHSWPEQINEILLIVKPPFWKTIWFYLIVVLLIAATLFYLHRLRIKQLTQKANIDKQLAQSEMKALHAQMNPHFIFNCLNSIREMILNNENEQASLFLSKFARLIRITLNQSAKQFVSLTDTIDYLERYIEMEKIRSSQFTYTIAVGADLNPDDILMPPMLIQPLIENAIWHGAPHKKSMNINISFHKNNQQLICKIEDNGIGIDESLKKKEGVTDEQSVGIANIRQRIELLNEKYSLQSTIRIEDKSNLATRNGTGTIVTLHLPIKTNENLWTT